MTDRSQVEEVLIRRVGKIFEAAGLDTSSVGANPDLNDPIGWALSIMEAPPDDIVLVGDDDLAAITNADIYFLLDLAELRCLETFLGNFDGVDFKLGPRWEYLSQLSQGVRLRAEKLRTSLGGAFNLGGGPSLRSGMITLDFAEHVDTSITDLE